MKKLVEYILEDHSSRDQYLFRVCCGVCGQAYSARPAKFSKAGIIPPTPEKQLLYDIIYQQEKAVARQRAVRAVAEHVNFCPMCRRIVCNRCFLICADLDLCAECAAAVDETGIPVADPARQVSGACLEIPEKGGIYNVR